MSLLEEFANYVIKVDQKIVDEVINLHIIDSNSARSVLNDIHFRTLTDQERWDARIVAENYMKQKRTKTRKRYGLRRQLDTSNIDVRNIIKSKR
jgi:hypothetical protein